MLRNWIFKIVSGGMNTYSDPNEVTSEIVVEAYTLGDAWGMVGKQAPINTKSIALDRIVYI